MPFTKMHGLGNDFIVINDFDNQIPDLSKQARILCDRRFGIGCDQLLIVKPSEVADAKMLIFNADGSEVEMCGNGIRCFAQYVRKHGIVSQDEMVIETLAGLIKPVLKGNLVEVDMGEPVLSGPEIPVNLAGMVISKPLQIEGQTYDITCVSMGNPHCVIFVEDVSAVPLEKIGPRIEHHELFPKRTNVEFVHVLNKRHIQVRVWERGSGITLACGTGACGTAVAAVLNGLTERQITVQLPGGNLEIHWSEKDNHVYMTGPGVEVFTGEIDLPL
ncbi:MAG: diaminopimelate epimerase [Deltaproteobacteria bacterium]|nr:diaminopimelate epimerase [Deltaproteobacteria bacterium]